MGCCPLPLEIERAFATKSWTRITHSLSFAHFSIEPPIISRLGSAIRIGGPLSHVANAHPSWYSIDVFATLIFLMACSEPGRCDSMTSVIVLNMR